MLASNVEIGIERDHARLHKKIILSSNHSEAYASLAMRQPEIVKRAERSPEDAEEFAVKLGQVQYGR